MAKTIGELLRGLGKKTSLNLDDEKLKVLFANEELMKIEVPEEFYKPIEGQLITIAEAKNNHQDIKNHYIVPALNGVDTTVDELTTELGLTDDDKNQLKLEKSSFKKVGLLAKLVQKSEQGKAAADKPDKKAWQDQINALNEEVRNEKAKIVSMQADFANKEKGIELRYAIDTLLSPHKTIHDGLPAATKRAILQTLISEDMRTNGLKWDFDDHKNVVLLRQDGTNYHVENQQVNGQQYIERVLASNKQLAVNTQQQNGNSGQPATGNTSQNGSAPASGNGQSKGANPVFKELMETALKDATNKSLAMPN